jgi:predicted AAA+ superfamily ATPase
MTDAVERASRSMPVVVLTGARQTGKSTLVSKLLSDQRPYYSLDDLDIRAQAEREPEELVGRPGPMVLDEVQRVPELLSAIKGAVDRDRQVGRYILTGSANLLLMRSVSESLAGRAIYLTLWPMSRRERSGLGGAGLWSEFLDEPAEHWPELIMTRESDPADWRDAARSGGYPVPAVEQPDPEDRALWFDGYIRTYLERDLQDLSAIDNLVDFRRLMRATCHRLGQLLNQTELGRDIQLPQPTVRRWLNLLETSFQLVRLPAYSVNRTKRLIKTPKAYWCDIGLALRLAGGIEPGGPHMENLILSDLLAWRDAHLLDHPELFYWRTATGEEVDLVVEQGSDLLGIEVKATTRPRTADAIHLKAFRDEYGDRVRGCLLLHGGENLEWLGPRILAAPWWRVI